MGFIYKIFVCSLFVCISYTPMTYSLWRSEFVECRHEGRPQLTTISCLSPDLLYCCYNNIDEDISDNIETIVDNNYTDIIGHHCCSLDKFLNEHNILLSVIHILVWINVIVFVILIVSALYLFYHSIAIREEEKTELVETIELIDGKESNSL
ncbi:uncharacterized protein LOC128957906 [Oppia nitens]|uniref:uncharacterized protein LOC128957906 n=1 Tax=Oppia nitens TaxID=1686743 RepID=UPI0023DA30C4|nr:uncharacterized protein LOC128957906 [Oppia nitens]